jgi:hypothetical protein
MLTALPPIRTPAGPEYPMAHCDWFHATAAPQPVFAGFELEILMPAGDGG